MAEDLSVVNQEPKIPTELWMLWVTHDVLEEDAPVEVAGHWLPSFDEPGLLCHSTEEEAIESAKHQEEMYWVRSKPVRVI